jgi:trans-L-3-hydroxyproline dehydratase
VDADALGIPLDASGFRQCIDVGMRIKRAVMASREVRHPESPDAADLSFLYGTILTGRAHGPGADSRNVCVFAEGEVDRSPTGTGVSARVAIEHARGRLRMGGPFTVESIIGTRFRGRALRTATVGSYDAVVPEVAGSAWIVGRSELWIAPDDPLREGFVLR